MAQCTPRLADDALTARFALDAGRKRAFMLGEVIPRTGQRGMDGGFVFVRSSVPLYGVELFFNRSFSVLSNVVPGNIAPGIAFAPRAVRNSHFLPLTLAETRKPSMRWFHS